MTPVGIPPADSSTLAQTAAAKPADPAKDPRRAELLKAARDFESVLVRQMLESLQKTTSIGGKEDHANSAYKSMAVDALADGIGKAGGLGLADLIAKTLESELTGAGRRP
jgi:Rod binding domain-containing protein